MSAYGWIQVSESCQLIQNNRCSEQWYHIGMWYVVGNTYIVITRTYYRCVFGSGCFRRVPIVPTAGKSPNTAMCGLGTLQKSMPSETYAHRISHEPIRPLMYFNYSKQYGRLKIILWLMACFLASKWVYITLLAVRIFS